jgi:hypothetical protein
MCKLIESLFKKIELSSKYSNCIFDVKGIKFVKFESSGMCININNINTINVKAEEYIEISLINNHEIIQLRSHEYGKLTGWTTEYNKINESKEFIQWFKYTFKLKTLR